MKMINRDNSEYLEKNPDYEERLNEFVNYLKQMPEVVGIMYSGSTAKRTWDKYSDIDIDIVIEDKDYNKFVKKIPQLFKWWGEIKLINQYENSDEWYAFVNENYLKIEIDPRKESDVKPIYWFKNNRIVYDKNNVLTKTYIKSQKIKRPGLSHADFKRFFLGLRNNFLYSVRHYVRGKKLSGASELKNIGGSIFHYLGKVKGLEGWEHIRAAEKTLSKKELAFLEHTRCHSLNKDEFKRALKANWQYMKYLEKMYENNSRKKLNLKCDDKEIYSIINKTLDELPRPKGRGIK